MRDAMLESSGIWKRVLDILSFHILALMGLVCVRVEVVVGGASCMAKSLAFDSLLQISRALRAPSRCKLSTVGIQ